MKNRHHQACWFAVIAFAAAVSPVYAQCAVLNIYDTAKFRPGQAVRLRAFDLPPMAKTGKESAEEIRALFMDTFSKRLIKSKFFGTVEAAATPAARPDGLTLGGSITGMDAGSAHDRIAGGIIGWPLGSVELRVFTTLSDSAGPIADAECVVSNASTGLLFKALGMTGMAGTARIAANGLGQAFAEDAKRAAKARKPNRKIPSELHGEGKPSATEWRDKPLAEWDKEEVKDAISNWVVTSNQEGVTRVDSLWVTRRGYEANAYFVGKQGRDTGGELTSRDWRRGFLLDTKPLERFRGQDVLVLALTYNRRTLRASPFLWNPAEVAKGTYLTRAGDGQRLNPLEVLDGELAAYLIQRPEKKISKLYWRSHPVIFVFPTKATDGKPFLRSINETVELRSVVEGQQVRIKYDLRNLGAIKVDELTIGGTAVATANR
ncbi:MAG: hypothetical protein ACKV2U_26665 [Bryobacteraceae bacterium]